MLLLQVLLLRWRRTPAWHCQGKLRLLLRLLLLGGHRCGRGTQRRRRCGAASERELEAREQRRDGRDHRPIALHVVVDLKQRDSYELHVLRDRKVAALWEGEQEEALDLLGPLDVGRAIWVHQVLEVGPAHGGRGGVGARCG